MTVAFNEVGALITQGLNGGIQTIVELVEDIEVLNKASHHLKRSRQLEAAANDNCECEESPSEIARATSELRTNAAAASREAHQSLGRMSAKYVPKLTSLWVTSPSLNDGNSTGAEKPVLSASKPEVEPTPQSNAAHPIIETIQKNAVKGAESLTEQGISLGYQLGAKVADEAIELGVKASKKLARVLDSKIPASVKALTCVIPTPWTMGACLVFGVAGFSTAVDDFEKKPSLKNFGRILLNGAAVFNRVSRLAGSWGEVGYSAAGAGEGSGGGNWQAPASEGELNTANEQVFDGLPASQEIAIHSATLFNEGRAGAALLDATYKGLRLPVLSGGDATAILALADRWEEAGRDLKELIANQLLLTHVNNETVLYNKLGVSSVDIVALDRVLQETPQIVVEQMLEKYPDLLAQLDAALGDAEDAELAIERILERTMQGDSPMGKN